MTQAWISLYSTIRSPQSKDAITLAVLVPIDNQIATWTPETIPPDWQTLRARWDTFHTARTFTSIASLTSLAWGTLRGR